jgi:hypothetical protein
VGVEVQNPRPELLADPEVAVVGAVQDSGSTSPPVSNRSGVASFTIGKPMR